MEENQTAFQRAKQRLGVSHPAEQVLKILDRVEALEKRAGLEITMKDPVFITAEPEKRRPGRPRKVVTV